METKIAEKQTVVIDRDLLARVREAARKHGFLIKALVEQGIKLKLAQLESKVISRADSVV